MINDNGTQDKGWLDLTKKKERGHGWMEEQDSIP